MSSELQTDLLKDAKIYGESLSKLPQDLYIPPDALEVYLDSFQGPLDLLLYLIRKNNIDIKNHIINSIHGHDAFLIETKQISDIFTKIF